MVYLYCHGGNPRPLAVQYLPTAAYGAGYGLFPIHNFWRCRRLQELASFRRNHRIGTGGELEAISSRQFNAASLRPKTRAVRDYLSNRSSFSKIKKRFCGAGGA